MKKFMALILIMLVGVVGLAFCLYAAEFDDFDRSLKDTERAMRQLQQQQDQQKFRTDTGRFNAPKLSSEDKAAKKNKELLDKFIASQNRDLGKEMDDWMEKFAREYRFIIEVFAIALAITALSFFFYKQKLKKLAQEKEKELQQARHHSGYKG